MNKNKIQDAVSGLNPSLHRHKENKPPKDVKVKEIYELMLSKAINK